ncbi:S9 family peptidase [Vitiosangium sp. GDMCC 1.1324]|uniref:S9 family peptidase n=1 Tax=Vitiosangium sp. (strain GDMCC 1.1324) TaxID=2138576 RepID=UPI000D38C83C|nr:S9 family peptidase [Vitiosangium sp. GDMCC 1.1324]PTL85061.1 oligopeptidase B [Vitiosangium sp. GDMCC 1.1324]
MRPLRLLSPSLAALLALVACSTTPPTPATPPAPAPEVAAAPAPSGPVPPVARRVPHPVTQHGDTRQDDYYWLREKESPEVRAYLEAEAAYTAEVMKPTEALRQKLYEEMLGRIQQTDLSVPYRKGGFFYYSRTEEGKQYPILCRKKGNLEAPEEVMLDLNVLAEGQPFLGLGEAEVSDDGNLLAYSLDGTGFRQYTLQVKDLRTGKLGVERMEKVTSVAWAADNRTLFYVTEDATKRPSKLWRHALGTPSSEDVLVYEEKDERFVLQAYRSRSGEYLFIPSESHTTSEVRVLPAGKPTAAPVVVAPREQEHQYFVDHRGDLFYIRTNSGGRNFRVVTAPVKSPGRANWKELIPHRESVLLEHIALFKNHLVVYEREAGLQQIALTDLKTRATHRMAFPEQVYAVYPEMNEEWDTKVLRISYQSPVTSPSVYDYDMASRERKLLKQRPVLGGYDASRYQTERVMVEAKDGAKVPVNLVYRKELKKDGSAPLMLRGYGAYGNSAFLGFNSNDVSLLDRGVVVAVAQIRGGSDLGKPWHDAGRMRHKMNTFTDFIAAAEGLIAQGYTSKERLAIQGGSAGGLLMGAVTNLRPDLFKVVVAHVPFVDVLNTMSDASLPLTVGEFEEWGNPQVKEDYEYMRQYCPYTNVAAKAYPTMLVKTSFNDSQVMYWEPAKWVAKLRALKTDKNPLLFQINMNAGHGGASGRYDRLKEIAFDQAFMLTQLGVEQ